MATNKSNLTVNTDGIVSIAGAYQKKIQTTVNALQLQLERSDLEDALPILRGLLDSIHCYAEELANDIDIEVNGIGGEPA